MVDALEQANDMPSDEAITFLNIILLDLHKRFRSEPNKLFKNARAWIADKEQEANE